MIYTNNIINVTPDEYNRSAATLNRQLLTVYARAHPCFRATDCRPYEYNWSEATRNCTLHIADCTLQLIIICPGKGNRGLIMN